MLALSCWQPVLGRPGWQHSTATGRNLDACCSWRIARKFCRRPCTPSGASGPIPVSATTQGKSGSRTPTSCLRRFRPWGAYNTSSGSARVLSTTSSSMSSTTQPPALTGDSSITSGPSSCSGSRQRRSGRMVATCWHSVAENLVYRSDLLDGIRKDLLCPFHYFGVPDEVDYRNIPWRNSRFDEERADCGGRYPVLVPRTPWNSCKSAAASGRSRSACRSATPISWRSSSRNREYGLLPSTADRLAHLERCRSPGFRPENWTWCARWTCSTRASIYRPSTP